MKNIYANFDGLDVAFHGELSEAVLAQLSAAKERAVENSAPAAIEIGGVPVLVRETGRRGGFAYVFDTGEDGEIWAVMASNKDGGRWMLHCSVHSAAFAQHGELEAIRDRLADRLLAFGFNPTACPKSGYFESVSRVDFAMDFHADDLTIDPADIASKATKKGHFEDISANWAGRIVTGITVGKMPNRQVIIYDKTREIQVTNKSYWWDVWGVAPYDGARVWRVELRAGKRFLSETWGIRTFDDVIASIGDLLFDTIRSVRLIDPIDSNVTRCPDAPLWERAAEVLRAGMDQYVSGLVPGAVRRVCRANFNRTMQGMLRGVAITYAAVMSGAVEAKDISKSLVAVFNDIEHAIESDPDGVKKAARRSRDRYSLIEEEEWENMIRQRRSLWLHELKI